MPMPVTVAPAAGLSGLPASLAARPGPPLGRGPPAARLASSVNGTLADRAASGTGMMAVASRLVTPRHRGLGLRFCQPGRGFVHRGNVGTGPASHWH